MFESLKRNEGVRVTLMGSAINIFLIVVKLVGGVLGQSTAMIADAIHSFSDLLNDIVVIFSYQIGRIPKDENHPYGHGKAESIGSIIIGVAVIMVGLGMLFEVWEILVDGKNKIPRLIAVFVAAISIVTKETLYRYTKSVGEKLHSPIIIANAWDQRSDALSSGAALIGVIMAMNGYPVMDTVAAGIVGLMILKIGGMVLKTSVNDLMDSSIDETKTQNIQQIIKATPGVIELHELRTRMIGGQIFMDVHILVDSGISVTEGHNIAETVRRELIKALGNVHDVLVHIDPEDDSSMDRIYKTSRDELQRQTDAIIADTKGVVNSRKLHIHYLSEKNIIEVIVTVEQGKSLEETKSILAELKKRLLKIETVDEVEIYLDLNEE